MDILPLGGRLRYQDRQMGTELTLTYILTLVR